MNSDFDNQTEDFYSNIDNVGYEKDRLMKLADSLNIQIRDKSLYNNNIIKNFFDDMYYLGLYWNICDIESYIEIYCPDLNNILNKEFRISLIPA